jgi:metal-dependent hydrolase (beta-lactamase superfamily II)
MSIEITVLADNTARSRYLAEWGLSILIETEGFRILFDTGRTTALHNAALMGKTPIYPHAIVLSHGHYDHTEGLLEILQQTGGVAVYAHPAVFDANTPCAYLAIITSTSVYLFHALRSSRLRPAASRQPALQVDTTHNHLRRDTTGKHL